MSSYKNKLQIVSYFNNNLEQLLKILQLYFQYTNKFDRLASSKISKALQLLKINKRTSYFIDHWLKNFPSEYRKPIKDNNFEYFFSQIPSSKKDSLDIFQLLRQKVDKMTESQLLEIFAHLNRQINIGDLYLHTIFKNSNAVR